MNAPADSCCFRNNGFEALLDFVEPFGRFIVVHLISAYTDAMLKMVVFPSHERLNDLVKLMKRHVRMKLKLPSDLRGDFIELDPASINHDRILLSSSLGILTDPLYTRRDWDGWKIE